MTARKSGVRSHENTGACLEQSCGRDLLRINKESVLGLGWCDRVAVRRHTPQAQLPVRRQEQTPEFPMGVGPVALGVDARSGPVSALIRRYCVVRA